MSYCKSFVVNGKKQKRVRFCKSKSIMIIDRKISAKNIRVLSNIFLCKALLLCRLSFLSIAILGGSLLLDLLQKKEFHGKTNDSSKKQQESFIAME